MAHSIENDKTLWRVDIFYSLPVDNENEESGIEWEERVESCRVSIPSYIADACDALAFIQSSCPYGANLVNASRITVNSDQ
jgi:hypothetical protein